MNVPTISIGLVAGLVVAAPTVAGDICETTARLQRTSAILEIREELFANLAVCFNETDVFEFAECLAEVSIEFAENRELLDEVYEARLELCDKLGGGPYDPEIDPDDFVDEIDNEYLPYPVGAEWVYTSETEDGDETIVVTVLEETREILGVECTSVRDIVSIEGEVLEDTIDWYAQDKWGNVWYFGEISFNYEDGYVVDVEGSWLSGTDNAKPGIVMLADPASEVGTTYRQEWLLGDAEDAGTVVEAGVTVKIGDETYKDCIKTADFLPPEPDALEYKYYAPGIGFIYETKEGEDETVEIESYSGL